MSRVLATLRGLVWACAKHGLGLDHLTLELGAALRVVLARHEADYVSYMGGAPPIP